MDGGPGTSFLANVSRRAAWLGLVFLVVYLAIIGGGWQGIYRAELRVASLVLSVVGLGSWIAVAVFVPAWRPGTVLWPAFVAALAVFGMSLAASHTPRLGADYLAYAILLTALYLLLQRFMAHHFFRVRLSAISIALLVFIASWYCLVVLQDWIRWWGLVGRFATPPLRPYFEGLTYGNPSAVMTMALLLLAPALAYLGFATRGRRAAAIVLMTLALAVTLLSGSRAGWLGLVLGLAITGLAWLALARNRRTLGGLLAGGRTRVGGAALLAMAGAAGIVFGPGILLRVGAGGEELRGTLYLAAIRMFQSSSLLGTGPGTWVPLRTSFTLPGEIDYYIPHAHSLYAQTLAEFGLLGVAAGLLVVGCLAWLIRGAITDPDPVRRRVGWAALFATTYFGAHQLLDFYPNMPATLFVFALPIAWLDATSRRPILVRGRNGLSAWSRRTRWLVYPVSGALLLASVAWLAISEASALRMSDGVALANRGEWAAALPAFAAAAAADPDLPPYQLALGIASANTGNLAAAAVAFQRSAGTDNLPAAWLDLAAVRAGLGDARGAREALSRSLVLGEQQASINLGAGVVFLGLGEKPEATAAFVRALRQAPSLAGDRWWQSTPDLAALWPGILDGAIREASPATGVDLALSAGDVGRARTIAASRTDPADAADRELTNLVIAAWDGDRAALDALYARAAARPLDTRTVTWCARLAARAGDSRRARAFRSWLDGFSPGAGTGGLEVRVTDAAPGYGVAGSSAMFYGHYSYRRPTPWDLLVPSLPHLVYQEGGS